MDLVKFNQEHIVLFKELSKLKLEKQKLENLENSVKEELKENMEKYNIDSVDNDYVKINKVKESSKVSLDTKKFKEKEPKLYDELMEDYSKTSTKKSYVRITVK